MLTFMGHTRAEVLKTAPMFKSGPDLITEGLKVSPEGLICEFGVWKGESITQMARLRPETTIHGFDSFLGLPSGGGRDIWPTGEFTLLGKLPEVPGNVKLYPGWFADTIPLFLDKYPEPVSFLHVDCDLYSSAKTVLSLLVDRIIPGTVIKFDEFWGFPNWEQISEARAFFEVCEEAGWKGFQCLGWQDEKVLMMRTA